MNAGGRCHGAALAREGGYANQGRSSAVVDVAKLWDEGDSGQSRFVTEALDSLEQALSPF